jgi:PAS domain S-box-containing protein
VVVAEGKANEGDDELARLRERVAQLERRVAEMFSAHGPVKLLIDPSTGAIVDANAAAAAFYGWSQAELLTMRIQDINQLPRELVEREMHKAREEQRNYFEFKHRLRSGELRDVQVFSSPWHADDGRVLLFSIIIDISERKRLVAELAHAQRMEALGRMAGALAHDFNNLLTATQVLAGVIRRRAERHQSVDDEVKELDGLVDRGAGLTRQLLAFCRRQVMNTVVVDLAELVGQTQKLVGRLLGENITVRVDVRRRPAPVIGDPAQLEQVLLNLYINARDAMPSGGELRVTIDTEALDGARAAALQVTPGRYVRIDVADTGPGLAADQLEHVFEPFFTTKPSSAGTGLGLSTVYGVARQLGGAVAADSVLGRGATFSVWMPLASEPAQSLEPPPAARARAVGGSETILLAEDDESIRDVLADVLTQAGYRVLRAVDGVHGVEVAGRHAGTIHLLLTDVAMPRAGGPELARRLVRERPGTRVLYMSGHVDTPAVDEGLLGAAASFLAKPFSVDALLRKVREVLDAETPPRGPTTQ